MKKVRFILSLLLVAAMSISFTACGGSDSGGGPSSGNNQENNGSDEDVVKEDYLPKLVGKWYYIEEKNAISNGSSYKSVILHTFIVNQNYTWEKSYCARLADDGFIRTIPGIDSNGTFTLDSNNMLLTYSSNVKYTWNFSSVALNQDILRIVEKSESSNYVENKEYQRFKYASDDDCLNAYISQNGISGGGSGSSGNNSGGNDTETPGGDVDVQGKVQGTLKAYGTEYSSTARQANGRTTVVDYAYYASTGKYYVYGGAWCSSPSANGGKGIRYDARKGYNSIKINAGAFYDSSTKTRYNWEVYLQVTLP